MKTQMTDKEIEVMRLFIAEALLCLSSAQRRSDPFHLDDLAAKAGCFMTGRQACEIIQAHDRSDDALQQQADYRYRQSLLGDEA